MGEKTMKPIYLDDTAALAEAVNAICGKAITWTHSAADLQALAAAAEKRLDAIHLPKAERVGAVAIVSSAGPSSRSYRYAVRGSRAQLRRAGKGWQLVSFVTEDRYAKEGAKLEIRLPEAKAAPTLDRIAKAHGITFN